ncbi:hypothetical protein BJF78_13995 [Pseudonocardia sp. CNS-139]|nr:hypothetical protein BJF78_13995 [Pseudonocardia sp. CNS-139]
MLAGVPAAEDSTVQVSSSGAAEALHALSVMTAQLATGAVVEDLIVTTTDRLLLVRVVEPAQSETALLVVTVDRSRCQLAMALRAVRDAGTARAR